MRLWLRNITSRIRFYCVIPLLSALGINMLFYSGTMILLADWKHYDLTLPVDLMVPVIPWFMYIYFGCFLFWVINYVMIGSLGKKHFYRFITADMLSRVVCGIFFILLPTTNLKLREAVILEGSSFAETMMRFLYTVDQPRNLFPSIHCLVSWFCFIGIRGQKTIPFWYRTFSCLFAVAVCISTQVTKQHYIVDAIGGIILAELLYYITTHTNLYQPVMRFFERINSKLPRRLLKEKEFGE